MHSVEKLIIDVASQIPNWGGSHFMYAFAAILVVYIFIVFGRSGAGA